MLRDMMKGSAGVRRTGSACLDLAYVAAGRLDGFWEIGLSRWDMAAGSLLITEAGGLVGDLEGNEGYMDSGYIVGGTPKVFGEMHQAAWPASDAGAQEPVAQALRELRIELLEPRLRLARFGGPAEPSIRFREREPRGGKALLDFHRGTIRRHGFIVALRYPRSFPPAGSTSAEIAQREQRIVEHVDGAIRIAGAAVGLREKMPRRGIVRFEAQHLLVSFRGRPVILQLRPRVPRDQPPVRVESVVPEVAFGERRETFPVASLLELGDALAVLIAHRSRLPSITPSVP